MPRLTDTQLVILSSAAKRKSRAVLPLPRRLAFGKATAASVLKRLLARGLIATRAAEAKEAVWKEDGGERLTLVLSDEGRQALGIESKPGDEAKPEERSVRPGTKKAQLIALLSAEEGAGIDDIVSDLDWQPHTARAAITRLRQKGFEVERLRQDGITRYRIVGPKMGA